MARFVRGVTYTKSDARELPANGLVGIIRANNIGDFRFDLSDLVYVPERFVSSEQMLQIGDVVVATSSGSVSVVGKAAPVLKAMPLSFGAFCGVLRPVGDLEPRYFGRYFQSNEYRLAASAAARGVNINNLKRSHFDSFLIAFPGREAQLRIAEKLDSVLSRVEICRARLDRIPQILKKYREAVLEAAVSGRLTEQWRGQNGTSERSWSGGSFSMLLAKRDGAIRRGPFGSTIKKSLFVPHGYKVYEQANAIKDNSSLGNYYIAENLYDELKSFHVAAGHFIVSCAGTIGRIAEIPQGAQPGVINQALMRIEIDVKVVTSQFFLLLFRSPSFQKAILEKTQGGAMQNLAPIKIVKSLPVKVPTLVEQSEIVRRVNHLVRLADCLQRRYDDAASRARKLTPSVLSAAFRGELVLPDLIDEPAESMAAK